MNIDRIDFSEADKLLNTVDDPSTQLNIDVARWIQQTDLVVDGQNVTEGMGEVELPVLCVLARSDFIVPELSVLSIKNAYTSEQSDELIDTLRVGADKRSSDEWYAHADLFIGDDAEEDVFVPMADWLNAH
jgi:alpha-beta hydrolase superfamily lysophospholipase